MAKMSDVAPVTEFQLVQLAGVAVAVGRAENVPISAALYWLVRQVEDCQLPPRLFSVPMSPRERIAEWAPAGGTSQWKLIAAQTERREVDADKMPTIAQSRYLHVDDLTQLAASPDTSEACRAALLELVARRTLVPLGHAATVPAYAGAAQAPSLSGVTPAETGPTAERPPENAAAVPTKASETAEPVPPAEDPKNDRGARVKRKALIERNRHRWPSIEGDLHDASDNGLSAAAKADKHGFWWEGDALKWAEARDKLQAQTAAVTLASVVHQMVG